MSSPSSIPHDFNYAKYSGIESVAAAVVFAVVYVPLFGLFLRRAFGRFTHVLFMLTLFCVIRITAFVLRAILAASKTAGHSLNLLIAQEVIMSVGFFGLLYSAYLLVSERALLCDEPLPTSPISRITRNQTLFRVALSAGVAVGITGAVDASSTTSASTVSVGKTLRKAAIIIFLVLTILQAYQTLVLARVESRSKPRGSSGRHGIYILCVISLLILVREVFLTATLNHLDKQNNERFWYPLVALPEVLAMILFATPGIIPSGSELPEEVKMGSVA